MFNFMIFLRNLAFFGMTMFVMPVSQSDTALVDSQKIPLVIDIVTTGLDHPWSIATLPRGDFLITERSGRLLRVSQDGKRHQVISGLPRIESGGQGGLLDVVLHPDFETSRWVYFSYIARGAGGVGNEVARAKLQGTELIDWDVLYSMALKTPTRHHFGSRLVFDPEGHLYITLGDRGNRNRAQDVSDTAGSVLRLYDDGRVPRDNPFAKQQASKPEIYSVGHRNIQGAAWHPVERRLWIHEHGPQGGDELNAVEAGANYGWPVVTYGVNYGSGTAIGEGGAKVGVEPPLYYWVPSIAPSGMIIYSGAMFPEWQGDVLLGSLKFKFLARLHMDGIKVLNEERLLSDQYGRVRDVRVASDGALLIVTDEQNGQLLRVSRAE